MPSRSVVMFATGGAASPPPLRQYPAAKMRRLETHLNGPVLIEPVVHSDERGFFQETFRQDKLADLGIPQDLVFVQENHSRSSRGVVRGMHMQSGDGLAKLVRCARGAIVDVIVDVRHGSPAYGEWEAFELNDSNHHQLLVPIGFAHGFCVVSEVADVLYKQSAYYDPQAEIGFAVDDPEVAISWPLPAEDMIVSRRDSEAPRLVEIAQDLPFRY